MGTAFLRVSGSVSSIASGFPVTDTEFNSLSFSLHIAPSHYFQSELLSSSTCKPFYIFHMPNTENVYMYVYIYILPLDVLFQPFNCFSLLQVYCMLLLDFFL